MLTPAGADYRLKGNRRKRGKFIYLGCYVGERKVVELGKTGGGNSIRVGKEK